jgi:energy-coupling factor transport system ATP-binding protein
MSGATQPVVSLSHVTLRYGDGPSVVTALDDVTLDVAPGERVCVLGANGSGKSTLASVICGLLAPDEGVVTLVGEDVFGPDGVDFEAYQRARRQLGLVFQNPDDQIVTSIVEEDVAFALENLGVEPKEIRARVDEALKTVGMYEYRMHAPHKLSGGQKQRVAIAGIIAMEPDCIVLDEPTAMLDPKGRSEVMRTIKMLNKEKGVTIVLITHYMEEAAQADRVVVIDGGEKMMDSVPKKVFSQVEVMRNLGLDVPQVTEIADFLNKQGYDISSEIITEDECVQALYELLKEKDAG